MRKVTHIIGIDEAGRGPLAGPVAVGAVLLPKKFPWQKLPDVADSKVLPEKLRNEIFKDAKRLRELGELWFSVSLVGPSIIDREGIVRSVSLGISRCFARLPIEPASVEVKLDGLLRAPARFVYQKTIVKGDSLEKSIGLASILAKVTRDAYMVRIAGDYPNYSFEKHKGYGTVLHRRAIKTQGLSPIHRKTFCANYLAPRRHRK